MYSKSKTKLIANKKKFKFKFDLNKFEFVFEKTFDDYFFKTKLWVLICLSVDALQGRLHVDYC